jgi:hypothetical protein
MAVLNAYVESFSGKWNRLWQRFYTVKWQVECDSVLDGPYTIRLATGIGGSPLLPRIGNSYYISASEFDNGSFLSDVTYEPVAKSALGGGAVGMQWLLTCEYAPYEAATFGTDPTTWPLVVRFGQEPYQRIVSVDQDGDPVVNSALCPYEDPVTIDDDRSVIEVVRREPIGGASPFDATRAESYRNTVNLHAWNGFAPYMVMCKSITTGDPEYDSNNLVWFYTVAYVFHINRDTWTKQILDQGYQVLGTDGLPTPVIAADGDRVDDPVLLDGAGNELGSGGTPVYRPHKVYPALDYSAFNIDLSLMLGAA